MKVDFFHSLPISRKKYFFCTVCVWSHYFVVPFIGRHAAVPAGWRRKWAAYGGVVLMAVRMTSFRILEYLAGYGTAILKGTAVFTVYIPAVLLVWAGMKAYF